ncbi:hypothetical protein PRZ48_014169 [Zasmidium cellare]|uniref:DUF7730 domain-containing protein n=1 Tax=Zasmidium cellare TaxID=395010 RepID=A0ABR0E0R3_ZASCE|nr:hypothetical protein PRZ48_014169 [Zasmidium cellare]
MEAPKAHFRLLDLPPEIRLHIYEYTLSAPVCLDHQLQCMWDRNHHCESKTKVKIEYTGKAKSAAKGNGMRVSRTTIFPPLLHTSQQLRREAAPVWYSLARFDYGQSATLAQLRALAGEENAAKIRSCRLVGPWATRSSAWNWLEVEYPILQAQGYSGVLEAHVTEPGGRGVVFALSATTSYSYYEETLRKPKARRAINSV